jgi:adenylate kinase
MIVVFLGPPGAGKGTQCKLLVDRCGLKHLSSGDILRRERAEGTELGKKAQSFMDSGSLVPDDLIVAMMVKEMGQTANGDGFVLDGFPRTIGQAKELDAALNGNDKKIDMVLNLEVDDAKLEQRITGRRSCSQCGTAYHIMFNPPEKEGICDADGADLLQRSDDTVEVVRRRIKTYHEQTAPLVSFYQEKSNLENVDGNVEIDKVTQAMYDVIDRNCG